MDRNNTVQIVIIVVRTVALRKESVDRNIILPKQLDGPPRRSPQGERG